MLQINRLEAKINKEMFILEFFFKNHSNFCEGRKKKLDYMFVYISFAPGNSAAQFHCSTNQIYLIQMLLMAWWTEPGAVN